MFMMKTMLACKEAVSYEFGKLRARLKEEDGAVDLVTIVILIGIAVLLALVFKEKIEGLLDNLFGVIDTNATNAVNSSTDSE